MHTDIVRCRETLETAVRGVSAADAVVTPLVAVAELARVGAAYVEDVTHALAPFSVHEFADRFTLALMPPSNRRKASSYSSTAKKLA